MNGNDSKRKPATGQSVRCVACGRIELHSPEDLLGFMPVNWPKCCGAVMVYLKALPSADPAPSTTDTEQEVPTLSDTRDDMPAVM